MGNLPENEEMNQIWETESQMLNIDKISDKLPYKTLVQKA